MQFEHVSKTPQVHDDAVIAPTAVISGDVTIGAGCQVLHGAVLTADGGPIVLGENVVVMENAVIRATAKNPMTIGSHVLVGPMASLVGATIDDEVFLATGSRVFNGAHLQKGTEVRVNAIVHLRTLLPPGTTVPIGWVAVGDPAQLFSPDQHEELWAVQRELDFPGYVFGVERDGPDMMVAMTRRYGASLAHRRDDREIDV